MSRLERRFVDSYDLYSDERDPESRSGFHNRGRHDSHRSAHPCAHPQSRPRESSHFEHSHHSRLFDDHSSRSAHFHTDDSHRHSRIGRGHDSDLVRHGDHVQEYQQQQQQQQQQRWQLLPSFILTSAAHTGSAATLGTLLVEY